MAALTIQVTSGIEMEVLTDFKLMNVFLSGFMKRLKSRTSVEGKWVRHYKARATHAEQDAKNYLVSCWNSFYKRCDGYNDASY